MQAVNQLGDANEFLNERAVVVMARMSNKLTGRDFAASSLSASAAQHAMDHSNLLSADSREVEHGLSVKLQVQKLIIQASSHENLCQNYVGYVSATSTMHFLITVSCKIGSCYNCHFLAHRIADSSYSMFDILNLFFFLFQVVPLLVKQTLLCLPQ